MTPLASTWLLFSICAGLIGAAGLQLSRHADAIAQRTGLSGSWIGLALVATVTSLPELATGITSVTLAEAPNLAIGDALGSCVVNLAFLVFVDLWFRKEPAWHRASQGHVLAGSFGIVMLGLVLLGLQTGPTTSPSHALRAATVAHQGFSLATPALLALYLVAMRTVFAYERDHAAPLTGAAQRELPALRASITQFGKAATVVGISGICLPFVASDLAVAMSWNKSFVGSLFVAMATSLPELAITLAALRIGAVNIAIGNLLGSNLFNAVIIAIDDLLYPAGSLLADVSGVHTVTATSAITMTALAIIGLLFKPSSRVLRLIGWIGLALLAMYLLNTYLLFLYGE